MAAQRLLSLAGDAVGGYASSVTGRAAWTMAAALLGATGAGFLVAAGYAALAEVIGPGWAMLAIGLGLILAAAIAHWAGGAAARRRRRRAERAADSLRGELGFAQTAAALGAVRWAPLLALGVAFLAALRR